MIYLDSSVVLARLFSEDRFPDEGIWRRSPVSSRLLQYEVWNRINARGAASEQGEIADNLLGRIRLIELGPAPLSRSLEPFPVAVRTLDGLHLATMDFLRNQGEAVELFSYDKRLTAAAQAMGFAVYEG